MLLKPPRAHPDKSPLIQTSFCSPGNSFSSIYLRSTICARIFTAVRLPAPNSLARLSVTPPPRTQAPSVASQLPLVPLQRHPSGTWPSSFPSQHTTLWIALVVDDTHPLSRSAAHLAAAPPLRAPPTFAESPERRRARGRNYQDKRRLPLKSSGTGVRHTLPDTGQYEALRRRYPDTALCTCQDPGAQIDTSTDSRPTSPPLCNQTQASLAKMGKPPAYIFVVR